MHHNVILEKVEFHLGDIKSHDIINLYGNLSESNFPREQITVLESSGFLQKKLWPLVMSFSDEPISELSSFSYEKIVLHQSFQYPAPKIYTEVDFSKIEDCVVYMKSVILLVLLLSNVITQKNENIWEFLKLNNASIKDTENQELVAHKFQAFFYWCWIILLSESHFNTSTKECILILSYFVTVFQSLEQEIIQRSCLPLCNISLFLHLSKQQREELYSYSNALKYSLKKIDKVYRALGEKNKNTVMSFKCYSIPMKDRFRILERDGLLFFVSFLLQRIEVTAENKIKSCNLRNISLLPLTVMDIFSGNFDNYVEVKSRNSLVGSRFKYNDKVTSYQYSNEEEMDLASDDFLLIEKSLELLIDLISQLPTRRFCFFLLISQQIIPRIKLSKIFSHKESALIRQLLVIYGHYESFQINNFTGEALTIKHFDSLHYNKFMKFQSLIFEHFKGESKLYQMAIESILKYENYDSLKSSFQDVSLLPLFKVVSSLDLIGSTLSDESSLGLLYKEIRKQDDMKAYLVNPLLHEKLPYYNKTVILLIEIITHYLHKKPYLVNYINESPLFPTESSLWDPNILTSDFYNGETCLALFKLNLQFLTIQDYLYRNFFLFELESTYQIRQDIEEAVCRMKPSLQHSDSNVMYLDKLKTIFNGSVSMACPIEQFSIVYIQQPSIGSLVPESVQGEILIDLRKCSEYRSDWDTLKQYDILFLVYVQAVDNRPEESTSDLQCVFDFPQKFGIVAIRGCEVIDVLDEEGNSITNSSESIENCASNLRNFRTIRVSLDTNQYQKDVDDSVSNTSSIDILDIYTSFNLLIRRNPDENNFKATLETMRYLVNEPEETLIPSWFRDLFLGYGCPYSAQYFNLATEINLIDFKDTFQDFEHVKECLPNVKSVVVESNGNVLNIESCLKQDVSPEEGVIIKFEDDKCVSEDIISNVSSTVFHPPESIATIRKYNTASFDSKLCFPINSKVRFTTAQFEAIRSGVNQGLTLILGPPGTGKTDTAVQIVNLLYQNFPKERILLVAHSNQALNDLFSKIANQGIHESYLLRLGRGEKDLRSSTDVNGSVNTEKDFSKFGRINYMLNRRVYLLEKVKKLRQIFNMTGEFESSCETAVQFFNIVILSKIKRYRNQLETVNLHKNGLRIVLRDMRVEDRTDSRSLIGTVSDCCDLILNYKKELIEKRLLMLNNCISKNSNNPNDAQLLEKNKSIPNLCGESEQVSTQINSAFVHLSTMDEIDDIHTELFLNGKISLVQALFPFTYFFSKNIFELFPEDNRIKHDQIAENCIRTIENIFVELKELRAFELLRNFHDRSRHLLTIHSKIIAMTCTHASIIRKQLIDIGFRYDSLIIEEAAQMFEIETFIPMVIQKPDDNGLSRLKRIILIGDNNQLPPVVKNNGFRQFCKLDQSMFARFIRLGVPYIILNEQGRCRSSLRNLFGWRYAEANFGDLPFVKKEERFQLANAGFCYEYQFIDLPLFENRGEFTPIRHFLQNKGEAEFAVALFMYMRLLGYPKDQITILTMYKGQKELIKEIIKNRCGWNQRIGWPAAVSTVDKFQGQQSDYVILSLVRTKKIGYLKDIRRFIVAVSRARYGLYIIGYFQLFKNCFELQEIISKFIQNNRPLKLALNLNELNHPTDRLLDDNCLSQGTLVNDVYEMWDILHKITKKRLEELTGSN